LVSLLQEKRESQRLNIVKFKDIERKGIQFQKKRKDLLVKGMLYLDHHKFSEHSSVVVDKISESSSVLIQRLWMYL
jgi:hypothetical protein